MLLEAYLPYDAVGNVARETADGARDLET